MDLHIQEGLEELQRLMDLFLVTQQVPGRTQKAQLSTVAVHEFVPSLQHEGSKSRSAIKGNTQWDHAGFGMCEISHLDIALLCVQAAFLHVRVFLFIKA